MIDVCAMCDRTRNDVVFSDHDDLWLCSDCLADTVRLWAIDRFTSMSDREYSGDWFGAYGDGWDVNIWQDDDRVRVTLYRYDGGRFSDGGIACGVIG